MLRIVNKLHNLSFGKLMGVYAEGNRENARESYPQLPLEQGILEAEQDFYRYLQAVFFSTKGAFYALWEENGEYVSALRLEPYRDGLLVEAVETAPERRRKGYARKLLKSTLDYLKEGKVYAHISKKNEASLALHKICGFVRISEQAVYIDGSVSDRCATYRIELGGESWQET